MRRDYYAVTGRSGYVIVTDYNKLESIHEYLKKVTTKKFDNYDEALLYAEDFFMSLNPDLFLEKRPKVGEIIFASHLRRDN